MPENIQVAVYPDEAVRMSDAMNLHAVARARGWVCFSLADGTSPDGNTVYETREEAILFRRWDRDNFVYLRLAPDGMSPHDAMEFLRYARMLHDNGYRMPDPRDFDAADKDVPAHDSMPLLISDRMAQIRELAKRKTIKVR